MSARYKILKRQGHYILERQLFPALFDWLGIRRLDAPHRRVRSFGFIGHSLRFDTMHGARCYIESRRKKSNRPEFVEFYQ